MARSPIPPSPLSLAAPWKPDHHEFVTLYHGCLKKSAVDILTNGIRLSAGEFDTDFGQGFYTTTPRNQAADWAYFKYKRTSLHLRGNIDYFPVVLEMVVSRTKLSTLDTLAFARGDRADEAFWSLVHHCRSSTKTKKNHHERVGAKSDWYDIVCGPLTAFWQQRAIVQNADQFSFHTDAAIRILDQALQVGPDGVNARYGRFVTDVSTGQA